MKVEIVRDGDARALRLPRAVIEQCGFGDVVELTVEGGRVVLSRLPHPREGWAAAFDAAPADAPPLLPDDASRGWDEAESTLRRVC